MRIFTWLCSHCGAVNQDNYFLTDRPRCSHCGRSFPWITLISREQITEAREALRQAANHALKKALSGEGWRED